MEGNLLRGQAQTSVVCLISACAIAEDAEADREASSPVWQTAEASFTALEFGTQLVRFGGLGDSRSAEGGH